MTSTTRNRRRNAIYYREGHDAALDHATAYRQLVDTLADLHLNATGVSRSIYEDEIARALRHVDEYEHEAQVWMDDAHENGYGPEDWEA